MIPKQPRGLLAFTGLALLAGAAQVQVPLKPELRRAAEVQAMAQACPELGPAHAERAGRVVDDWWVRNPQVADAVHVLYFGVPSPEQAERRQAFEGLQRRFLAEAELARATDRDAFVERCGQFLDGLEGELRQGRPVPAGNVHLIRVDGR
jgi:hypothetical protein